MLKKNPNSWEGHKLTGDLALLEVRKDLGAQKPLDAKKAIANAISEYRTALASNAGDYSTTIALARALELDDEPAEAEVLYTGLTNKEKQNTLAYIDLYQLYLRERKFPDAESLLKRAIQNNPKDTPLRTGTGALLSGDQQTRRSAETAQPDEERPQAVS